MKVLSSQFASPAPATRAPDVPRDAPHPLVELVETPRDDSATHPTPHARHRVSTGSTSDAGDRGAGSIREL